MGRYYRVFAEAKVKDKWVNFNPYIVDLGGKVKLIPLIGYEQSVFYEAYEEMGIYAAKALKEVDSTNIQMEKFLMYHYMKMNNHQLL